MNRLLAALTPHDRDRLTPHLKEVHLDRGRVLFEVGALIDHVYFPTGGIVSLVSLQEDGGSVETGAVGCEGIVAINCLLGDRISYNRAVVQLPGGAKFMPVAPFMEIWEESPSFRRVVMAFNHAFATLIFQSVACNTSHPAEVRLARWILMCLDRCGDGETVALTHEYLADMLGVGRPTITVVARTLQAAGLIRYSRGVITVLDRAGLEAASCECYWKVRDTFQRLLPGSFG
ncbi:Crp/Fnr family transcriptional regulator [Sphingoaurantiacus capsulatus]|uniref:Crp/Fnr family transcriptional regulator n=1 Tax=Sphingoaurantiacus capsulatus TaxID=1771310 RepID=A0ABV7XDB4_9SPHN